MAVTNQVRPPAQMLGRPPLPQGVPLTDSMELSDRNGTPWLAYIEGIPRPPARFWKPQSGFPGRRLRFDSATDSRVVTPVPAGSPFLGEARLQELLDRSESLHAVIALAPPPAGPERPLLELAGRPAWRAAASLTEAVRQWW